MRHCRTIELEQRNDLRSDCFSTGEVLFGGGGSTSCSIWNMSEAGALIEVDEPSSPPDAFELIIHSDRLVRSCIVVRRTGQRLGVAFTI